jgi:hypothetical protein
VQLTETAQYLLLAVMSGFLFPFVPGFAAGVVGGFALHAASALAAAAAPIRSYQTGGARLGERFGQSSSRSEDLAAQSIVSRWGGHQSRWKSALHESVLQVTIPRQSRGPSHVSRSKRLVLGR